VSASLTRTTIRGLQREDRPHLERILAATGVFYPDEVAVAMELIDIGLDRPGQTDYRFLVAETAGAASGYACYGPVPMTDRSWDLYWIAVDPALHGRGTGRALIEAMESDLEALGARVVFVDTAGREPYRPTRRFYEAMGYTVAARLAGFYRADDDKVVYTKGFPR
jgi:ribosomal protein S18 acetylase RimI-like enzyme